MAEKNASSLYTLRLGPGVFCLSACFGGLAMAAEEGRKTASGLDSSSLTALFLAAVVLLVLIYLLYLRLFAETKPPPSGYFLSDLDQVTDAAIHHLNRPRTSIGRRSVSDDSVDGHIQIPLDTISRLHASLEYRKGGFWLLEHGAANGVFVNGVKVRRKARLSIGDTIKLHKYRFNFKHGASGPSANSVAGGTGSDPLAQTQVVNPRPGFAGDEQAADFDPDKTLLMRNKEDLLKTRLMQSSAEYEAGGRDRGQSGKVEAGAPGTERVESAQEDADKTLLIKPRRTQK